MKKSHSAPRLVALDGLRGLAALSVFLSKTDFSIFLFDRIPFATFLFKVFSSGLVGVQVLFVLSGFLMSSLYPVVTNKVAFWQKRYARIFPVFLVVVLFLWLANRSESGEQWFFKLQVLLLLASLARIIWIVCRRSAQKLFLAFVVMQIIFLLINILLVPHFTFFHQINLPKPIIEILVLFSNLTLITPFANGIPLLAGAFWSLAPEIIFYLLYPVLVIPLVKLGKQYGWLVSFFLIIAVTKILFDLQTVFSGLAGLQSLKVARATGFMVGVIIGSLNQTQHFSFLKLKSLAGRQLSSLLILSLFLFVLWINRTTTIGVDAWSLGWFYGLASISIGAVIVATLTPQSLLNRFFSCRLFTFLGMISYSFYLIHYSALHFGLQIMKFFGPRTTTNIYYEVAALCLELFLAVSISWLLYVIVEHLYFEKKHVSQISKTPNIQQKNIHRKLQIFITSCFFTGVLFWIYSGGYSPSILVSHAASAASDTNKGEVSLLQQSVSLPIRAQYNNLSALIMSLRYAGSGEATRRNNSHPAVLIFRLYDATGKQLLFESRRHAYEIEGEARFPFGFPSQTDSSQKKYLVELVEEGGGEADQIMLNGSNIDLVAQYSHQKKSLPTFLWQTALNRIQFVLSDARFRFAFLFLLVTSTLSVVNQKKVIFSAKMK